ncbi:MAG: diaminopimelate decarboxylase [Myxococcales bacterium]|nr:diaminopimelate decarboxylase [Myxococcales bacterium]
MSEHAHPSWVVLKFGGTSVSSLPCWQTIADVVRERCASGLKPVVVCSALSGITNSFERLLDETQSGDHEGTLAEIKERHRALAQDLGLDADALLSDRFDTLERLALGASLVGEVSPRLRAEVMACGELMSTTLGAAWLNTQGIATSWLDARTCLTATDAPEMSDFRRYLSASCDYAPSAELSSRLAERDAQVILTQGFIARLPSTSHTVLLGRGGSDTSATYFASLLSAQRCEIWTDVPGMYSANPRQVQAARLLWRLGYDEAQEIASTGAKVLHPRCIAPVRRHNIPLHICCTNRPEIQGTIISDQGASATPQVKAISVKTGQVLLSMDTPGMWQQVGFLADVFACFKQRGLSIDLVSTSEMNVTVSLDPASNNLADDVLTGLQADLGRLCRAKLIDGCAAISLVGRDIRAILHKLGPALEVFEEHKIHLVSQAASDLNLTVVLQQAQADRLVSRLHRLLFKHVPEDGTFGPTWSELFVDQTDDEASEQRLWWHERQEELVQLAGEASPRYVYDGASLDGAARALLDMNAIDRVFYAIKANPNPDILRRFHEHGLGFECVSPGELERVQELFPNISPERILYTPNFAPREEYAAGLERGVWVTLDNLHPLESWPELFAGRELFVRIDPGQGRGHHDYVKTAGARSKFGISVDQLGRLQELLERADARVIGLHAHSGSGILSPEGWSETALLLTSIADRFPHVRYIDLGGGLGVPEKPAHTALDLGALDASLQTIRDAHPRFEFWLEPGRFLVAQAGVLLATVTQLKTKTDVYYVGIDAGMNSLIRPALYGAYHAIVNLSRLDAPTTRVANIVGPICETGDTLGYDRRIADPQEGDVLLIANTGAYGRSMSSWYNLRAPAAEVVID